MEEELCGKHHISFHPQHWCIWSFHLSHLAGNHPEDLMLLKLSLTWKTYRKVRFKRADTSVIFCYLLEATLVCGGLSGSCPQLCRYSLSQKAFPLASGQAEMVKVGHLGMGKSGPCLRSLVTLVWCSSEYGCDIYPCPGPPQSLAGLVW